MGAVHDKVLGAIQRIAVRTSAQDVARLALTEMLELTGAGHGALAWVRGDECHWVARRSRGSDEVTARSPSDMDRIPPRGANARAEAASAETGLLDEPLVQHIAAEIDHALASAAVQAMSRAAASGTAESGERGAVSLLVPGRRDGEVAVLVYLGEAGQAGEPGVSDGAQVVADHAAVAADRIALRAMVARSAHERDVAKARCEAMQRDLDDIKHTVSHDLRTPLTSIMGFTQILLDDLGELPEEEVELLLSTIDQSCMKMVHLLEELQVMLRMRKGPIECEMLDMGEIISHTRVRLGNLLRRSGAELEIADSWPMARAYRPWVSTVWSSLIRSSLGQGKQVTTLMLGSDAQDQGSIRFWVRDDGPGLSTEELERVLGPLVSGSGKKHQRTGLVLAREMVERQHGHFAIESTPGEGTTYHFTLPAA